jgi:hypothetical protein
VFCPTCQTNEFLQSRVRRSGGPADDISDDLVRDVAKDSGTEAAHRQGSRDQEAVIEDAGETEDRNRDLVHGDGGTIDLPTKPGDLSKDD